MTGLLTKEGIAVTGMDIFNLIAGICSILSLFVSLFVANKVINMKAKTTGKARSYQAQHNININK